MPRLPDRKGGGRGSFYIQMCVKTVSAELTADLHRVKVRDAVSSVNENHALWKRRSGCYEETIIKQSELRVEETKSEISLTGTRMVSF